MILNAIREIGPITTARMREKLAGRLAQVFELPERELMAIHGVGPAVVHSLRNWREQFDLSRELKWLEQWDARFICQTDDDYPASLQHLPDPPLGLYWKGSEWRSQPSVAIVGSRKMTSYGESVARDLAASLARMGWVVISGMARGIDTAAHWGALEAGGITLAVLGHGLEQVYPPENGELRQRILQQGGILTEFPFGRKPDRQTFPMRNRLVSGLADAVVIVETDVRGGSMITAQFAADQGKTVFAVPGRIDRPESRGCHVLIRDGAVLLTSVDDILEELNVLPPLSLEATAKNQTPAKPVTPIHRPLPEGDAALLWPWFAEGSRWNLDQLVEKTTWPVSRLQSALLLLELQRFVRKCPDGRYEGL